MSRGWLDSLDRLGTRSTWWASRPLRKRIVWAVFLSLCLALIFGAYVILLVLLMDSFAAPLAAGVFVWTGIATYLAALAARPEQAWALFVRLLVLVTVLLFLAYGVFVAVTLATR
jgi:uncharacterized membrane protein HdeD (DUF308 family)